MGQQAMGMTESTVTADVVIDAARTTKVTKALRRVSQGKMASNEQKVTSQRGFKVPKVKDGTVEDGTTAAARRRRFRIQQRRQWKLQERKLDASSSYYSGRV